MKQIPTYIILLFLIACTNNISNEWTKLNDKYFEYDKRGLYDSALNIEKQALAIAVSDFPINDMRIASTYNNVGEMYRELGQPETALDIYKKAIEIAEINNDSLNLLIFHTNLGLALTDNKQFDLAEIEFKNSISIIEKSDPKLERKLITPLSTLGLTELYRHHLIDARKYLTRAHRIVKSNYSEGSIEYGIIYQNIGMLLLEEKSNDSAFYYLKESRRIKERLYGLKHPILGSLYGLIGVYYHVNRNYDSARKYYEMDINSRLIDSGHSNPRGYQTLDNLGQLYLDLGDSIRGKQLKEEAIKLIGRDKKIQ